MTHYEILEVSETASQEVIKMAYKALLFKYHPDKYKGDGDVAHDLTQRINEAFSILSNPELRMHYDGKLRYDRDNSYDEFDNTNYTNINNNYKVPLSSKLLRIRKPIIWIVVLLVLFAIGGGFDSSTPSKTQAETEQTAEFSEPQVATPPTGLIANYTNQEGLAPFEIKTSSTDADYYIKMTNIGENIPMMTLFINGGETLDVNIPIGVYEVKYAVGQIWYGEEYLFGPETQYTKFDQTFEFTEDESGTNGWTIDLLEQVGGNLDSSYIDPESF